MKKILPISVVLVMLFSMAYSQAPTNQFKSLQKNPGSYKTTFNPKSINGQSHLKSARIKSSTYSNLGNLSLGKNSIKTDPSKIIYGNDSVTPIYIEHPVTNRLKSSAIRTPRQQSLEFLESAKAEMKIANPSECFFISHSSDDDLGQRHIRMLQKYKGVKVYNSDFYIHVSDQKEILNGKYCIINQSVNTTPKISKENALKVAITDLEKQTTFIGLTGQQKQMLEYNEPVIDTVITEDKQSFTKFSLAYQLSIRPNFLEEWIYFVNAANGSIIKKYNNTNYDGPATANATDLNGIQRSINTYLQAGKYYLMDAAESMYNATKQEGLIITLDAKNTSTSNLTYTDITSNNNAWSNPTAVSAHFNAMQAYKYLKNTFNRNSINGQGGSIISLINVTESDGSSMENAFWNGKAAFYGNGGSYFKPLAGALDVAAHELGHGVISNTANLEYQGQSGAINEGYADIFGAMVDRDDWYLAEDVTKTAYVATGRLRDMSNPHNGGSSINDAGWQPMHMKEIYTGTGDNGGVHTNSGVCNYAYYLFATAVTKEKAEKVFYRALTTYLTRFSQYIGLRVAVIQAAKDLYGDTSVEVDKAKASFDSVGVYDEQQTNNSQGFPVNPGQDYLLCYNTDATDANTLYRSSVTATDFSALTKTAMKGKVSVVDNGSYAVFVSTDHKLRSINLDPAAPTESIISNNAIWDNVAVSKDGKRVAAISAYKDTSIYVYDYNSGKWGKFVLYNPTTQNNQKSGGVNYADAIDFDHSGEYLIYDSYNTLRSSTGDSLNYWDIGLIHVWDNKLNKFADGEIMKLFGSLPDSVSIGNPVFSKNSPNVIAFDYLNESANQYAIFGMNIEKMDYGVVATNVTIGYPTFSKSDNRIAYSSLDASNNEVIGIVDLNPDKISPSGSPSTLITGARWPVYYATGTRTLGFAPVANFSASYKSGKTPLTITFTDLSVNNPVSWLWTFESGTPASSTEQTPTVTYNTPGTYSVTLKASNSFGNNTVTKSGYIVVTNATGIEEASSSDKFKVYPNPTMGLAEISIEEPLEDDYKIDVFNYLGGLVQSYVKQKGEKLSEIDLSANPSGIYLIRITLKNRAFLTRIMKK